MKPAPFEYHAPRSVEEAAELLRDHGDDAKVLAGGQSLVPMLALRLARFDHLVDLTRIAELRGTSRTDDGIRIGAMTTQTNAARDPDVARSATLIARATPFIGHQQIRNRGTVGGSLAHADPAAELPAVACVLDAEIELVSTRGTRRIPAAEFFVSTWMTAAEPDEIVTAVHIPETAARCGFAIDEVARRHGDFAMAGATCAVEVADDHVARAAVALFGMASTPLRLTALEESLVGLAPRNGDIDETVQAVVDALDPPDDLHATAELRRRIARKLLASTIRTAFEEASRV